MVPREINILCSDGLFSTFFILISLLFPSPLKIRIWSECIITELKNQTHPQHVRLRRVPALSYPHNRLLG